MAGTYGHSQILKVFLVYRRDVVCKRHPLSDFARAGAARVDINSGGASSCGCGGVAGRRHPVERDFRAQVSGPAKQCVVRRRRRFERR